jgi:peptidoglycan/LPS O-acetylase OafA/YrhL
MSTGRLDSIDRLRALAMLAVVAQHCGLFPMGWTGVWLFYVISGYVITAAIIQRETVPATFWRRYGSFLWLRLSRIVPAFWMYLALCLATAIALGHADQLIPKLGPLLGFYFNWDMVLVKPGDTANWPPLGHLWTVSVEQQFYLVFPFIAMLAPPRWRLPICLALIAATPLIRGLTSLALDSSDPPGQRAFFIYAATHCHIDAFLAGSVLAYLQSRGPLNADLERRLGWCALSSGAAYFIVYGIVNHHSGAQGIGIVKNLFSGVLYGQGREVFVYVPVVLFSCWMVCRAIRTASRSAGYAALVLAWMGRVSYSAYLLHNLVIWLFITFLGTTVRQLDPPERIVLFTVSLGTTLVGAAAMYRWVEKPAMELMRSGRKKGR